MKWLFDFGMMFGVLAPATLLVDESVWRSEIETIFFIGLSILGWAMIAYSYIF